MANVLIEENTMYDIANAIRSKTGENNLILPKDMPKKIKEIKSNGEDVLFQGLIEDNITGKVTTEATSIRKYIFAYTTKITEVEATNASVLDDYVFYFSSAEKITLSSPDIGNLVFAGSPNLSTLILKGNKVANLTGARSFVQTPIEKGVGYIYVPKNLIEEYKVATNWSLYPNQFRAIEDYPNIARGE